MTAWEQRSVEEANLLNPAFCGAVLTSTVAGYAREQPAGMPFTLSFLVLPVVLHKSTRERLPRSMRTSLAAWLDDNPSVRLGFAERMQALASFTREGLLFAGSRGAVTFTADARLVSGTLSMVQKTFEAGTTDEVRACLKKALFVGRWLASAGAETTVLMLWGVRL